MSSEPAPAHSSTPPAEPIRRERPGAAVARAEAPVRAGKRAWASRLRSAVLWILGLCAAAGLGLAWIPKPVGVELAEVVRGQLLVTVDEDGRTRVKDRYTVSAPLLANLARIELKPGDEVEVGTVLARFVPLAPALLDARTRAQSEARVAAADAGRGLRASSVERVRTALEFAQREAARQRALGSATSANTVEQAELKERELREELASAEFSVRVADHDLQMAEAALGRVGGHGARGEQLELTAPVKGRILRVIQQSEGAVQPGTPLLEIGDPAALEIAVDVLTSDAVHVRPGARAFIERWGGEAALRGHVRIVEPSAFTRVSSLGVEEQRVNVVIDLDEPRETWVSLGDGYRVEARIATWQGQDVLSVPASAVFRRHADWAVFRVEAGVAHVVTVEVGHRNADRVEIKRGLREGERVIAHPSERVADGTRVAAQ